MSYPRAALARVWSLGGQIVGRALAVAPARAEPATAVAEPVTVELTATPRGAARLLGGILAVLLAANLASVVFLHVLDREFVFGFVPQFGFDEEANVPTWFNAMILLSSGLLLAAIATAKRRSRDPFALHWTGLAGVFLFLSLDEATSIHELLMYNFGETLDLGGALHFVWVAFYGPLAVVFAFVYLRFLFSLPRRTMLLFVIAGALYVGGAAGMEMVGGSFAEANGEENLTYALITTLEELLEMTGVVVFVCALLAYARESGAAGRVVLRLGDGRRGPGAGGDDAEASAA